MLKKICKRFLYLIFHSSKITSKLCNKQRNASITSVCEKQLQCLWNKGGTHWLLLVRTDNNSCTLVLIYLLLDMLTQLFIIIRRIRFQLYLTEKKCVCTRAWIYFQYPGRSAIAFVLSTTRYILDWDERGCLRMWRT